MALTDQINSLATRVATEFKSIRTALSGKSNTGHTHSDYATNTALTNGLAGKAAASHVHSAADITSGTLDRAVIPSVLSTNRTVNRASGTIDINANSNANNVSTTLNLTGTVLNVPTNGSVGQVIQGTIYASAAADITFHANFGRLTGIAATVAIPSGKHLRYALRATDASGSVKWLVESVGVEQ